MTPIELLSLAGAEFGRRVAAVPADRWDAPTPCDPWTARQLVAHVVGGNRMAAALLRGASAEQAAAIVGAAMREAGPEAAYLESADEQLAAFTEPEAFGRTVHHPAGDMDGLRLFGFRLADLTLHAWDLARATGGDERLPDELVAAVWGGLSPLAPFIGQTGFFGEGPSGTLGEDSPLQDRLLDLSGRRP